MDKLLWPILLMMFLFPGCGFNDTPTRHNDFTPLTSIEISADSSSIPAHTSMKLSVKGNYSGMFTRDITDQAVWSSDSPNVAGFISASNPNRVTAKTPGSANLTASVGSVSATFNLSVNSATVTALTITPAAPTISKGLNTQFTVSGTFSDSLIRDLTFDAAWASSAPDVAAISNLDSDRGVANAIATGTSTITATFDGVSGSTLLTVTDPVLESITLTPANPSILTLSTGTFKATGKYSDGSTPDLTSAVIWSSSNTACATISSSGKVTTLKQGSTTISAALGSISGTTSLKTTGGDLVRITVSPATARLVKDIPGRISATGTFSNNGTRDITGAVEWTTADSSIATVTIAGDSLAWLNPLAATTLAPTTIKATSGSLSAETSLTVIAPQLTSIALSTTRLDLTAGTSSPLTVAATFNDGTVQDVTTLSEWTSNDSSKATVATAGMATIRVTGVAAGTTTISAKYTYSGKTVTVPTPATVTIRSQTLQSLIIEGSSTTSVGNRVSYKATAHYFDSASTDVTADTTWSIDKSNVAVLTDSLNLPGQLTAVDNGTATLSANFGGKSHTFAITVTP